jgi:predicted enzyme related to lactoylglutathione lyase
MAVSLHHIVIDAHDLPLVARFWTQVLGWRILSERPRVGRRVEIGQTGDESWTVLADPEGNEFCILRPKTTLIS